MAIMVLSQFGFSPEALKDRILDSAELLFAQQGIASTSLRAITDHAGFYFENNLQIRTLPKQRRTQLHVLP